MLELQPSAYITDQLESSELEPSQLPSEHIADVNQLLRAIEAADCERTVLRLLRRMEAVNGPSMSGAHTPHMALLVSSLAKAVSALSKAAALGGSRTAMPHRLMRLLPALESFRDLQPAAKIDTGDESTKDDNEQQDDTLNDDDGDSTSDEWSDDDLNVKADSDADGSDCNGAASEGEEQSEMSAAEAESASDTSARTSRRKVRFAADDEVADQSGSDGITLSVFLSEALILVGSDVSTACTLEPVADALFAPVVEGDSRRTVTAALTLAGCAANVAATNWFEPALAGWLHRAPRYVSTSIFFPELPNLVQTSPLQMHWLPVISSVSEQRTSASAECTALVSLYSLIEVSCWQSMHWGSFGCSDHPG